MYTNVAQRLHNISDDTPEYFLMSTVFYIKKVPHTTADEMKNKIFTEEIVNEMEIITGDSIKL